METSRTDSASNGTEVSSVSVWHLETGLAKSQKLRGWDLKVHASIHGLSLAEVAIEHIQTTSSVGECF